MINVLKVWFILVVGLTHKVLIKCEPDWTYDLISVDVDNKTPDKVYIELHITRVSRGVFVLNGFFDIKEDLTDEFHVSSVLYYSWLGSEFVKTPFYIPESNFSTYMNTFYKDLFMDSLLNCSKNAPQVDGHFEPPFTKRVMYLNNCYFSNENMPSKLRSGYYKCIWEYSNKAEGSIETLVKVESKW